MNEYFFIEKDTTFCWFGLVCYFLKLFLIKIKRNSSKNLNTPIYKKQQFAKQLFYVFFINMIGGG